MKRFLLTSLSLAAFAVASVSAQTTAPAAKPDEKKKDEKKDQEVVKREEVVVVTASKVESTLINAPATMSVVSADTIASSPAQNYGDLLRSVPGLNVIQMSARDINITSRQNTSTLSNSQLALLDGRSIYLDFFGLILWDFVPQNPAEIKQIEVVRGPASAVWGANALTGVINIITKTPREATGFNLTLTGGLFDRKDGSRESEGDGHTYGLSASFAQAPSDKFSYRITAGYYNSDPLSRPVGSVPVDHHPLDASIKTGGAKYPTDVGGPLTGASFENKGTSQPKFDLRLDQELSNGGKLTFAGGIAGTQGIVHTGIGPFRIESGSKMGYGKINYSKGALKINAFANILDAKAPNLLVPDATGNPVQLNFKTQTYDLEIGDSHVLGGKHIVSYGGNARRNNFEISLAPNSKDRNEFGAYVQDEIFFDKFRFALGARVDKFGNIDKAVFSPRLSAMFKPTPDQSLRVSFNRAFRAPSTINNYLDQQIIGGILDLRPLIPALPLFGPQVVAVIGPLITRPYPVIVNNVGNPNLKAQSLNAYEIAYTGTFAKRTTVGIAVYQNDLHDDINFTRLAPGLPGYVPYTAADPPPGISPVLIGFLAQLPPQVGGPIVLPKVAATYLNLSGLRQRGLELSIDHAFTNEVNGFANYSFQNDPKKLDADPGQILYPTGEISIAPRNRFNAGINVNMKRFLGSASVNHADKAFWTDVLDSTYDGYSPAYTMVNASFGVRWSEGKVVTSIKGTNLFNEKVQQHTFGDIIKRSVFLEVRFQF